MRLLSRQEIKENAKQRLRASSGPAIGVYLIGVALSALVSFATAGIGAWLIIPAIAAATSGFFVHFYDGVAVTVSDWFSSIFDNFLRKVGAYLWMGLWTFIWSLLFIIPGIIKAISYMFVPYIVARYPDVTAANALKISKRMTDGYKMDLFIAGLSFLGWEILSGLTFGILEVLYVGPYRATTFGGIYQQLECMALESGTVTQDQFAGDEVY